MKRRGTNDYELETLSPTPEVVAVQLAERDAKGWLLVSTHNKLSPPFETVAVWRRFKESAPVTVINTMAEIGRALTHAMLKPKPEETTPPSLSLVPGLPDDDQVDDLEQRAEVVNHGLNITDEQARKISETMERAESRDVQRLATLLYARRMREPDARPMDVRAVEEEIEDLTEALSVFELNEATRRVKLWLELEEFDRERLACAAQLRGLLRERSVGHVEGAPRDEERTRQIGLLTFTLSEDEVEEATEGAADDLQDYLDARERLDPDDVDDDTNEPEDAA